MVTGSANTVDNVDTQEEYDEPSSSHSACLNDPVIVHAPVNKTNMLKCVVLFWHNYKSYVLLRAQ